MKSISRALSGLTEWIGKNQEMVKKVALIVAGVVGVGAAFIGIGSAAGVAAFAVGGLASMFSLVGTAIGVLVTLIGALFTPLGLVVAAVAALGAYFIYSTGIAGQAIEYLKGVFETLKADTIKAFGAIANALSAGDITAAANVLWTYLKLQWIKGQPISKACGLTSPIIFLMFGAIQPTRSAMSDQCFIGPRQRMERNTRFHG